MEDLCRLMLRVIVDRPIDEVFDYWADLENGPEWAAPVIERRKLTDGPVGVGPRYHAIDRFPGRNLEFEVEVTAFDPNRLMAAGLGEPMNGTWEATFEKQNGGTTLRLVADMSPPGPLKILSPLMGGWMKRVAKDLRNFKERLENARG